MTGTLQIAELTEQPGAILVQWYDEVRLPSYSIVLAEDQEVNKTKEASNTPGLFSLAQAQAAEYQAIFSGSAILQDHC